MVVWSGGTLTPGTAITRPTENICGNSTCLKTPLYFKEGRLKPFFANNVDIPFARARRLNPCPRKATVRSGKQPNAYLATILTTRIKSNKFMKTAFHIIIILAYLPYGISTRQLWLLQ